MESKFIVICKSNSGDNYYFKTDDKNITAEKFDEFVSQNISWEYEDGVNYLEIEDIVNIEDLIIL